MRQAMKIKDRGDLIGTTFFCQVFHDQFYQIFWQNPYILLLLFNLNAFKI